MPAVWVEQTCALSLRQRRTAWRLPRQAQDFAVPRRAHLAGLRMVDQVFAVRPTFFRSTGYLARIAAALFVFPFCSVPCAEAFLPKVPSVQREKTSYKKIPLNMAFNGI